MFDRFFQQIIQRGRQTQAASLVFMILIGVGGFGTLVYKKRHHEACKRSAVAKLELIRKSLDQFKQVCGRYPLTREGLAALSHKPGALSCPAFPAEGFVASQDAGLDPWGSRFVYSSHGDSFVLRSLGSDGRPGGVGTDRDLGN